MRHLPYFAALSGALLTFSHSTEAAITISIFAGDLRNSDGSASVVQGTLLQLINLGPNGVFDPIDLFDGDVSQSGQWVSGDDTLLNIPFANGTEPGDFASAAAFDLIAGPDPTTGRMSRTFRFQALDLPSGTKIGLRWFSGLLAADFATTTLSPNQKWGEFTRASNVQHSGTVWISPSDGATMQFDGLATASIGGNDANSAGYSNVPEPTAIAMSFIGAAGLAMLRRRRA
jgi:hypothetical protein